ncbi:MAG: hypothetical protein A2297_06775 [Elusimicrobia bacterium RIFOXYB2_FULL_48_7]|nr:MAG: hypothetical protein A2297_06775 [Elusimicrobia bacterium RIFOXYB2_FULL_48_7]
MQSIAQLEKDRAGVINSLPDWSKIVRGSMRKYYGTCGNKGCRCHKDKKHKHGPYWYVAAQFGVGKQKVYLISKKHIKEAKAGMKAYNELWDKLCKISTINLEILKAKKHG